MTPRLDEEHGGVTRRFCTTLTSHECLQAHNERDVQPKNDIQESSCFPVEICAYANCAMTERIKREQDRALAPHAQCLEREQHSPLYLHFPHDFCGNVRCNCVFLHLFWRACNSNRDRCVM